MSVSLIGEEEGRNDQRALKFKKLLECRRLSALRSFPNLRFLRRPTEPTTLHLGITDTGYPMKLFSNKLASRVISKIILIVFLMNQFQIY